MKREDWQKAYEPLTQALEYRVKHTLDQLSDEDNGGHRAQRTRKVSLRTAIIVAALVLALGGVAYAMIYSKTADLFGWFYGDEKREELLAGDIAFSGEQYTLGDVVYTLDEAIYKDGWVYGLGTIKAVQGSNIVLITEDYHVDEAAGYMLYYGGESIPEDAPSYKELAQQRGAKIILAKCVAEGIVNEDGSLNSSEIGYSLIPQADGTIQFSFEFEGGTVNEEGRLVQDTIQRALSYQLKLRLANWEVDEDGYWLRDDPDEEDTLLRDEWVVQVTPTVKGE